MLSCESKLDSVPKTFSNHNHVKIFQKRIEIGYT